VQKVVDPLLVPVVGLRLRQLVLMVRELEVEAPGVDVDGVPNQIAGHGGACNVPPGPTLTPWGRPERLPAFAGLGKYGKCLFNREEEDMLACLLTSCLFRRPSLATGMQECRAKSS
jgi:hypothetical protein